MNEMTLSRTRPVLPSLLGYFAVCPAKYLLESEAHSYARLPLHPGVILGQVIHQRVNSLTHREAAFGNYTLRQLENDFMAALTANRRSGAASSWIYARYGIAGLMSRQTLVNQIRYVRSLLPPVFVKGLSAYKKTLPVGREVILTSGDFDMHGRADLIYQERPDRLNIVDLKTGKVRDEQNQPKEINLLQVVAYGIMVKEQVPDMDIGLVLTGSSDSWEGTLNTDLIERVTTIIKNINRLLPRNIPLSVRELARPGTCCSGCSYRCSCPAWTEKLRKQMQASLSDYKHGGIDISGKLLEVESDDHLLTLKILLSDNAVVKVFRVPSCTIPKPMEIIGKKITLYGLNTFSEALTESFPRNFYVINMQDTRRSAFQFHWQSEGEN